MYSAAVKLVSITIPEDLDERAAAEARRQGISKSELFRRGLDAILPTVTGEERADPWRSLAGFASPTLSTKPGDIDDIVYDA